MVESKYFQNYPGRITLRDKEGQKEDRWVEIRSESRFLPTVSSLWQICLPEDPATPGEVCPLGSVSRQVLELPWGLLEDASSWGMPAGTSPAARSISCFLKPTHKAGPVLPHTLPAEQAALTRKKLVSIPGLKPTLPASGVSIPSLSWPVSSFV